MKAKRSKPVAKPVQTARQSADIFGFFAGKGRITGDVVAPALTPEEWGRPVLRRSSALSAPSAVKLMIFLFPRESA